MTKKQKKWLYWGIGILVAILIYRAWRKKNASNGAPLNGANLGGVNDNENAGGVGAQGGTTTLVPETGNGSGSDVTISRALTPISSDSSGGAETSFDRFGLARVGEAVSTAFEPILAVGGGGIGYRTGDACKCPGTATHQVRWGTRNPDGSCRCAVLAKGPEFGL